MKKKSLKLEQKSKEKEKLENIILQKELKIEKFAEEGKFKEYGVLQKEIDTLNKKYLLLT
jgi:hypothetical protein